MFNTMTIALLERTQEEFFEILRKNSIENGVGFDVRTAEKILRRVNRIIRTAYYIYQEEHKRKDEQGKHEKLSDDEKAKKVTWYLLGACYYKYYKNLDEVQINRLKQSVKDRLIGVLQKSGFFKQLDKPFKTGGVGLNSKTAKAMTEELELILILGFGIVQKMTMDEIKATTPSETPPASTDAKVAELSAVEKNIAAQQDKPDKDDGGQVKKEPTMEASTVEVAQRMANMIKETMSEAGATADKEEESEKKNKLYLSGEEAAQLARSGVAFDTVEKEASAATSKSGQLEEEIKEAENLAAESAKALRRITPETAKFISDVAKEYEKNSDDNQNK